MRRLLGCLLLALALVGAAEAQTRQGFSPAASLGLRFTAPNPLPALPLPTGASTMFAGHSFVEYAGQTSSGDGTNPPLTSFSSRSNGEIFWIRGLDGRFNIDTIADFDAPGRNSGTGARMNAANQGVASNTLTQFIARLPYIIARRPAIVCLTIGINDITISNRTTAQITTDFDTVLTTFFNAGIWAVIDTIAPVGSSVIPDGDTKLTTLANVNTWIRSQSSRGGVKVHDLAQRFGGDARPDQTYWLQNDQTHPQERGAYQSATSKLAILQTMVSAGAYFSRDPTASNVYPSATLAGTGGTASGGVTGSVATGYAASMATGDSTAVASKETSDVSGYEKQVFTITRGSTTGVHALVVQMATNPLLTTLGLQVGDWVKASMQVEFSAWDYWMRMQYGLPFGSSSTTLWTTFEGLPYASSGIYTLPNGNFVMTLESDPFVIPSDVGSIDRIRWSGQGAVARIGWNGGSGGGTATVKISKPILRKVANPRPVWNLN